MAKRMAQCLVKAKLDSVSLVDVFPTLLEFAGLHLPEKPDGRSLLLMVNSDRAENRDVFIQYDGNGSLGNFQRCLVRGSYKLIVDIFKDETFIELYDISNDQQETRNLAFDDGHKAKTKEFSSNHIAYNRHFQSNHKHSNNRPFPYRCINIIT